MIIFFYKDQRGAGQWQSLNEALSGASLPQGSKNSENKHDCALRATRPYYFLYFGSQVYNS